jgi:uncharacterized repeat protein (TIGR01451 family)
MKYSFLYSIVFSVSCLFSSFSFAQGFQITAINPVQNSAYICDSIVDISISALGSPSNTGYDYDLAILGGNFTSSQFQVIIDWGDGTTTTHYGGTSSPQTLISFNPPISHGYSTTGTHVVVVQVINLQNTTSAIVTLTPNTQVCSTYLYAVAGLDCNNDGTNETAISNGVPIIITDGINSFSGTTSSNMTLISGVPPGTYTITVDPFWLNTNAYSVASISPSTMVVTSNMTTYTTQINLICTTPIGNNQCISGIVFCDANGNSAFDVGEQIISNAPVNIQANGQNYTAITDQNGVYSITYIAPSQTAAIVSVNPNWLSLNGFTTNQQLFCLITTDCSQSIPLTNFPIICGNSNPTQGCVSGFVWCDLNNNGIFNSTEIPLMGAPIILQGNQNNVTVYSDSTGFYSYCGTLLNQSTVVGTINSNWLATHGYTISNNVFTMVSQAGLNTQPLGFGLNCGGTPTTCADLWTTVTPWIGYYQNQTNYIKLNYGNYGPGAPGNYTLTLTFPLGVTPITSSINIPGYSITGNTITWNLNTSYTSFSQMDIIYFNTPSGIPSGTQHFFTSTINPTGIVSDCCTSNNNGSLLQLVGNSYDPNDKTVDLPAEIATSVQDELTYTIRFQNTGTAPAQDVFIIDTLSANLDWTSISVVEASHAFHLVDLGNGVVRFDFPQIWLADSTTNEAESHGHVVFKISEQVGNLDGSEIFNTGYIYFDWNPAIITGTTYNINGTLGIDENNSELIQLYPNPVNNQLNVSSETVLKEIHFVSLSGQSVLYMYPESKNALIDMSALNAGIYLVNVVTESGTFVKKVVKK